MNANELPAEQLAQWCDEASQEYGNKPLVQVATMLRQQQAEYYSLLVNHDKLYAKVLEQQAEIEALKTYKPNQTLECSFDLAGFKPPAKTLTDEEIIEIWSGMETDTGEQNIIFARAILRKAQEK